MSLQLISPTTCRCESQLRVVQPVAVSVCTARACAVTDRNPGRSDRTILFALSFVVGVALSFCNKLAADERRIDFLQEVWPIWQRSCVECHGASKQEGNLRLDSREATLRGGDSGPVIVANNAQASELMRRVSLPKGHDEVMPAVGATLSKKEIATLRSWVQQGANLPDQFQTSKHWAYTKPIRPAAPKLKRFAQQVANPIDHFVMARLEAEQLSPSPPASSAALIRRVSLDLTGLPPSPAEVHAFFAECDNLGWRQAYEQLVNRLLASPHFGERWARPWLDLARYADSHGFQRDDLREVWAYRDWVIHSINADMPFDQFTIEQVAGDLLPQATISQRIATGFHRCTTTNVEAGSDPEETRTNQVIDRVNTTGSVWLGTTLECAQCHSHKYDPFTQREYYQLLAFFNNTQLEADRANPNIPGSIKFLGPTMELAKSMVGSEPSKVSGKTKKQIAELEKSLATRKKVLASGLEQWLASASKASSSHGEVHLLDVVDFDSSAGSPHKVLDDKSVLLVDDAPDKDTYTVVARTKVQGITGFKLEALTDPSLPGTGPGRGNAERPNFVLNSLTITAAPVGGGEPKSISLRNAAASFSQPRYAVAGAIDNDPETAWGIAGRFFESHWATFETTTPLSFPEGCELTFTLVQNYGGGRTIGRLRLAALTGKVQAESLPREIATIAALPATKRSKEQTDKLLNYRLDQDEEAKQLSEQLRTQQNPRPPKKGPTTLVMQELTTSRSTMIFQRGDFRNPGEAVQPGVPASLHPLPIGPPNRLTLARWLVDRENPLVARVVVNRWWAELFGRGLVSTVEDFGIKGEPPTHPELLDWLAVEFMESGWSMKHVLKTIVTSAAYCQSSRRASGTNHVAVSSSSGDAFDDPDNTLLSRGPRFRLDAETIRDNALSIAGLLSRKQGGPPIRPYQPDGLWQKVGGEPLQYEVSPGDDAYRRGIYVVWKRAAPYPSFVNFDASSRLTCTVKRSRSNTPLQALTLLNDPVYVEIAEALAERIRRELPAANRDERLRYAFQLCVARQPKEEELQILRTLFEQQAAIYPQRESAPWFAVAVALLNLDETITKN